MAVKNGWFLSEFTPSPTSIAGSLPISQEYYYANKYYGMSEAEMNTNLDRLRRTDNRSQLKKHLMQTQALQQYNVNLSSGTEKNTTYASLMYEKNDEATIKRGYERFMVNFNNTYKFTPWLAASVLVRFNGKKRKPVVLRSLNFVIWLLMNCCWKRTGAMPTTWGLGTG